MTSVILKTEPMSENYDNHTAVSLAAFLRDIIKEFGFSDRLTALTTDNHSVEVAAAKIMQVHHIRCFGHYLNLVVKNSLS